VEDHQKLKLQGKAEGKLEDLLADHPEIAEEISRLIPEAEKEAAILIQNSKNVVTAPINSGGGNVHIGDKN